MKRAWLLACVLLSTATVSSAATSTPAPAPASENKSVDFKYGKFGQVKVVLPSHGPERLLILASDRSGLSTDLSAFARSIVDDKTAVASFDVRELMKGLDAKSKKCSYPAGDLELLSKYLQTKLRFPQYAKPVLVGLGEGATLVYGALAQAPENTFGGAVSLGFCPEIPSKHAFCQGYGLKSKPNKHVLYEMLPTDRGLDNWWLLTGALDKVCSATSAQAFSNATDGSRFVSVGGASRDFSNTKLWAPKVKDAVDSLWESPTQEQSKGGLADLPLVPMPAEKSQGDYFVVFLSGDGGWAGFDDELATEFNEQGIPVVGWNSLKYFWSPKSPEAGSKDLARVIKEYQSIWKRKKVVVVGYSFGADVAPFFTSRLPLELKRDILRIALLGAGKKAEFEFHFSDWVSTSDQGRDLKSEIASLKGLVPVLCLYGEDEADDSVCPALEKSSSDVRKLPGGHHFNGDSQTLFKLIAPVVKP